MIEFAGGGKKEQIMEAALAVFSQKGFHLTKIEEIAQQAGVGKGTVYEYFSSKETLFKEIIKEANFIFERFVQGELGQAQTTRQKLEKLMRQSVLLGQRFHPLAKVAMLESVFLDSPFYTWLMEKHTQRIHFLCDLIGEGIRKGELRPINRQSFAHLFYGGLAGIVGFCQEDDFAADKLETMIAEMLDYYFQGIAL